MHHTFHVDVYGEWGPVIAVVNSADHYDQSVDQVTAHSGTPSRVNWNVGVSVTLDERL
jgi:hypothetical protein